MGQAREGVMNSEGGWMLSTVFEVEDVVGAVPREWGPSEEVKIRRLAEDSAR